MAQRNVRSTLSTGPAATHPAARGFTIVELLIVIVVIGILAAISIVAYSGIQNRANNSVIQGDLRTISKKIELYRAEFGDYPTNWNTLEAKASKGSYGADYVTSGGFHYNLLYCRNNAGYAVAAGSKSGTVFSFTSASGQIAEYSGALATSSATCPALGISTSAPGWNSQWYYSAGAWSDYV